MKIRPKTIDSVYYEDETFWPKFRVYSFRMKVSRETIVIVISIRITISPKASVYSIGMEFIPKTRVYSISQREN